MRGAHLCKVLHGHLAAIDVGTEACRSSVEAHRPARGPRATALSVSSLLEPRFIAAGLHCEDDVLGWSTCCRALHCCAARQRCACESARHRCAGHVFCREELSGKRLCDCAKLLQKSCNCESAMAQQYIIAGQHA